MSATAAYYTLLIVWLLLALAHIAAIYKIGTCHEDRRSFWMAIFAFVFVAAVILSILSYTLDYFAEESIFSKVTDFAITLGVPIVAAVLFVVVYLMKTNKVKGSMAETN